MSGTPAGSSSDEAIVLVDLSPTWLPDLDTPGDRLVWDQLAVLLSWYEGISLPVIPVNDDQVHRVSFRGLRRVYLAGIYGRLAVDTVARYLTALGIEVVFIVDGIIWSDPGPPADLQEDGKDHDSVRYQVLTTTAELRNRYAKRAAPS